MILQTGDEVRLERPHLKGNDNFYWVTGRSFFLDIQMEKRRGKWIDYFDLKDAFKIPGCPLCNRVKELSYKFLDNLYYERVLDGGTRVGLIKAKGFCNWHAWMSAEIRHSDSGIAIIYKQLLDIEIERLSNWIRAEGPPVKKSSRRAYRRILNTLLSSWIKKASCPICEAVREHERMEEGVLLDFIDEEEFSQEFEKSSGICIRHLVRIMETFGEHPSLPRLIERQLQKYKFLSYELGEYDRKRAYQFSNEPKGSETDSWRRVIEQFVGKREVFGNEMNHIR
jgi:hypothetical protein